MIIDTHNHADWYSVTRENYVKDMDKNGIDKTWLLSCETPFEEYDPFERQFYPADVAIPFENALPYVEKYPDRFVLGYAPDPRRANALDRMKFAVKAYGVKVCGEVKFRMMADNPDAVALYRWCGENGLPVVMHCQLPLPVGREYPRSHYWYNGGIDALERAMKAAPETTFIGHAQSFWAEISGDGQAESMGYPSGKVAEGGKLIKMLDKYPKLYCDMSAGSGLNALKRDPEFAKKFLTDYADRVLYARDSFTLDHKGFLLSLGLDSETLDKIFCKNAQELIHETE